jgi:hypothetical protein
LPNLIGDHIAFLPATGGKFVLAFGEHKFFIHGQGTAFVAANQFAMLSLVGIHSLYGFSDRPQPTCLCFCAAQSSVLQPVLPPPGKKKMPHNGGIKIL